MDTRDLIEILDSGGVIAIPTDTVYGFAVRPDIPSAVKEVFALKGRPPEKPLPVLTGTLQQAAAIARFDARAVAVAERFWPGPVTIVVPRDPSFTHDLGGDERDTVAVRIPSHSATQELLGLSGPLAVTSANRSGEPAAADPADVARGFPEVPLLDGGRGEGEPSTVVDLTGEPRILRPGPQAAAVLRALAV